MKWAWFIIAAALVWPLADRLRRNPQERLKIVAFVGFLPGFVSYFHLYMALVSWRWIGYVRGGELSILDFLCLAIYLSLPRTSDRLPFRLSMGLYFITTMLSAFEAEFPETALFYSWQLARMFLVYATIYRGVCADPRIASAVLKGMAAALFIQAGVTIWQWLGTRMLQTPGTYIHQNTLGMISHFTVSPFFALLLAGRQGWLPPAVLAAGLVVEIMTASRGTILLGALGLATVFLLSAARRWNSRKAQMLLAAVAATAVLAPLAASSLQSRFAKHDESFSIGEDTERLRYKAAAAAMLSDHPMGVGANNFTYVANRHGYFDLVGEEYLSGRSGNVHSVYWLVASETGYIGLISFIILLIRPLMVALACGFRQVADPRGDLLLGLGVALLLVYLQSTEEWVFVTFDVQYPFAIEVGLVAGLARGIGYWSR